MIIKRFNFSDDLVEKTADIIKHLKISPANTLIIAPSKRFFYYLANKLYDINNGESLFSPNFITSDELITGIISTLGLPLANSSEQLEMMIRAIKKSEGYEKIIPRNSFENYSNAISSSKKISKLFGEILKNKIPDSLATFLSSIKNNKSEPYKGFNEHINILISISKNYEEIQKEENNHNPSFLIPKINKNKIEEYFEGYQQIILISPTALTKFEKNIYSTIDSRLIVITQDCNDYDFSSIRDWPETGHNNKNTDIKHYMDFNISRNAPKKIFYSIESSILHEISRILYIIKLEINNNIKPNEILVLNLDNLLSEVLFNSLNSYGIPVNFSQGFNIKSNLLYQFLSSVAEFFTNHKSNSLIKILNNQIFSDFARTNLFPDKVKEIKDRIIHKNIHLIHDLDNDIFNGFNNIKESLKMLSKLYNSKDIKKLYNNLNELFSKIGSKRSYEFNTVKEIIDEAILEASIFHKEINDKLYNVFLSILSFKRLPQIGSYKEGIQILGLLETRGISFKTVIIPSFNEGIFPSPSQDYRLFNSSLRRSMDLPSFHQQEDLEFYYLKRLIDSSKKSYILSLSSNDGSTDIPSRYTYIFDQGLLSEIDNKYIIPAKQVFSYYHNQSNKIDIDTPRLNRTVNNFSRLDIDRIKKCQTRYFIAKILNITDEQILAEEIDMSIIGTIIHRIFYELYADIKIPPMDNRNNYFEEKLRITLKNQLNELLNKHLKDNIFYTEEIGLVKEIIRDVCFNILENDIGRIKNGYKICGDLSEKELSAEIGNNSYIISGRIDRVDKTPSGKYMIIDYKTGILPSVKSHTKKDNFREVQLGVYGLLFKKNFPEYSIFSLNYYNIKENNLVEIVDEDLIDTYLESFEKHLADLLERINNSKQLTLAEDLNNCVYCPYKSICRVVEI